MAMRRQPPRAPLAPKARAPRVSSMRRSTRATTMVTTPYVGGPPRPFAPVVNDLASLNVELPEQLHGLQRLRRGIGVAPSDVAFYLIP